MEVTMARLWIGLGALAGLLAVAMAAATAHATSDDAARQMAHSAVEMQAWHALALLGTGLWVPRGGRLADVAGAAFALGLLAFCGAVYALALAGVHAGPVAPAGGVLLMLGWALLGVSAIRPAR
jgi:uncharacterized membrane protein YgdD (TMEM256/DUF423 family)